MKNKILFMSLMLGMTFCACDDRDLATLNDDITPPVLNTPHPSEVTLSEAIADYNAIRISWDAPDYGYQAPVSYTVKMDVAGNSFADAIDLATTLSTSVLINTRDLNSKLFLLGGFGGQLMNLELKVIADIKNTNIEEQVSNVVTFKAIPYEVVIVYPHLNLPGSFTPYGFGSWNGEGTEFSRIYSLKSDDRYEGYVYMVADGDPSKPVEFKFTKVNWGDGEYSYSGTAGSLVSGGGGNIPLASGGYYKVNADINSLSYSVTKINTWGLIGDATTGGWDSSTPMNYNPATNLWTVTTTLTTGGIKFRANDGWDLNYGDTGADFKLDAGGDNIAVTAGNYTITLDLAGPVYKYKMVKN